MRRIELLAPAGNADIAIEAIKHGADAVYIGPPTHGARKSASNSLSEIKRAVDFAHLYNAKVYVTVNTLVYDHEISEVEEMIRQLYRIGVDALIVQDMGILRMNIPPIALHASTQCDIRTPEKAKFLEEAGFSQLVLARELSIEEIKSICDTVSIPVEVFIHGALCVSYSGRCSAGYACSGRSGNRGECPQICRQAFTLKDASGEILARDKYLLSLKDLKAEPHIEKLMEAGVTSFKIEGRLKEAGYVKNVVAYYSNLLNEVITTSSLPLRRESAGDVSLTFKPNLYKSFNRGFTDYRLSGSPDLHGIASTMTPKSLGEPVTSIHALKPGDGISYFDIHGEYTGAQVNGVNPHRKGNSALLLRPNVRIPEGTRIFRTASVEWKKLMTGETAKRTLSLDISLDPKGVTAQDETGAMVRIANTLEGQPAKNPTEYRNIFSKLGNTPFVLKNFQNEVKNVFYPASALTSLRRELIEKLLQAKTAAYRFDYRRKENEKFQFPYKELDYRDNVANRLAEEFYKDHGVEKIEKALETTPHKQLKRNRLSVMTTRHCILRELGLCMKKGSKLKLPLSLESGNLRFQPEFDCTNCEMRILKV